LPKSNQICSNLINFAQKVLLEDGAGSPAPRTMVETKECPCDRIAYRSGYGHSSCSWLTIVFVLEGANIFATSCKTSLKENFFDKC